MATKADPLRARPAATRTYARFRNCAWAVLIYNILVVVWGAYVRATGSGAGCGSHWPLCNGEVVPLAASTKTVIEFTHRASSGLAAIAVLVIAIWAWRAFPRLHPARRWANLSVVFIVTEALLGAGLVLFRLVEHDDSLARTLSMPLHLVNTFILLACLTATAWFARSDPPRTAIVGRPALLVATLPLAIAVSATGAVAALGDTLFPAASLTAGIGQDFAATAHVLLRLRLIHPVLAFLSALVFAVAALRAGRPGRMVLVLVFTQIVAGVLNIALLAPVWMQLLHLLIADVLWVSLVVLVFEAKRHQVG